MSVSGGVDERIRAIASLQHGLVSRGQLRVGGVSNTAVARRVAWGRLRIVHHGVLAVGHDAPAPLADETAALLAVRAGGLLSDRTSAILWRMIAATRGDGLIHVTVDGSPGGRPDGVVVHRSSILKPRDRRVHQGLPLTSPARTLLDIAPSCTTRELERAFDEMLIRRVGRAADVVELLRRAGRHPGAGSLRGLVARHTTTTFTRSEAEERMLGLVRDADQPQPLVNVRRHGFELDFLWPDHGIAVEIDGYAFHGSRLAFEQDRRRDVILKSHGIDVLRFTWRQLVEEPIAVIARLVAVLTAATPAG